MKTPMKHAMLAVPLCCLLLACSGDETGGGAGGGGGGGGSTAQQGLLDAQIVGSPTGKATMKISTVPAAYAERRDTANGERISVHGNIPATSEGFQKGEQSLRIYLQPFDGPRTYTLDADANVGAAYAEADATHTFYAEYGESYANYGSGTITIDARTEARLSGSFAFTAEDQSKTASVTVTGTFDLPLLTDSD